MHLLVATCGARRCCGGPAPDVVDEAEVSAGAVGRLTLAVFLVVCVRVFEMPLAMLAT